MQYNVDKREVIHFGQRNRMAEHYLTGARFGNAAVQRERDLGVLVYQSQSKHANTVSS